MDRGFCESDTDMFISSCHYSLCVGPFYFESDRSSFFHLSY